VTSRAVVLVLAAALATGCGGAGPSPGHTVIEVFGAASLQAALERIANGYGSAAPGVAVAVSTDSSAALETKIAEGAPADVFLSADLQNAQGLVDAGLAGGSVVPFAANRLAIIVPAANPAGITGPAGLARPGVKVVAAGAAVPITAYAERLLANLAALPGSPSGFAAAYASNIASREDSVAAVVAKVALGEGDVAIVYATDATGNAAVARIPIPDGVNVRATYGGVIVKATVHPAEARAFLDWLVGPDAQAILSSLGFLAP
jgi:molybdate transport system substrate-binding protein